MFELSLDSQQSGTISTPPYNHLGLSDYQDPLYALNPSNSSQLLSDTQPIIDTVIQSIDATGDILTGLSSNSQINEIMGIAFGQDYQKDLADQILQYLSQNNFTNAPDIKLVSGQSFNGAYAKENNTIYLSQEFVAANLDNVGAVTGVLLEEFGHYVDGRINVKDAAGDEGDIFSRLVRGQSISAGELVLLKAEDDHGVFVVDSLSVGIEKNDTLGTAINLGTPGNACYYYSGWVGTYSDSQGSHYVPNDYYRFQINSPTKITLDLVNLQSDVDLKLLDSSGSTIYSSSKAGTANEKISAQIASGTYYIQVNAYSGNSNYNLGITTIPSRMNPNTDVDGDGKADAIVSNDNWVTVRRSTGTGFSGNERWTDIGYAGKYGTWFADVTGDGRADAIAQNDDGVYVRRSDGTKFLPNEKWTDIGYGGKYGTWFADVTGDGRADAIVSNDDGIYVRRASSDGKRFLPNEKWTEIGYGGAYGTFFADVNGDGKVDAIVSTNNSNNVTVRLSNGTQFLPNQRWTEIPFAGQNGTWFADVTGDGKADAIAQNDDGIYIRRSDGTKFLPNEKWTEIGYGGTYGTFFGDVTGDGKADAIVSTNNVNNVTVRRSTGSNFSGNERWTEINYAGTQGTFIGDIKIQPTLSSYGLPTSAAAADSFFKCQFYNAKYNPDGPSSSSTCGPTSLAMIIKTLGLEPPGLSVQQSINRASSLMGQSTPGWTPDLSQIETGIRNAGGNPEYVGSWDTLDQSLAAGKPVSCNGWYGVDWRNQFPFYSLTGDGNTRHQIAILGRTSNGLYIVADPMYRGGVIEMTRAQLSIFFKGSSGYNGLPVGLAFARR